jgi:O-antigen/teichoic acid export membrane protein
MASGSTQLEKDNNQQIGRKVAKNSIASMGAVGVYFFSRLALTPFILHYVDLTEFGLWSMCFVILSYAGLGVMGVNGAYIKFTAEYQARNDQTSIGSLLSTGIVCMTVFCLLFYAVLYLFLPYILEGFHVSSALMATASFMILGTALAFCLDFTLGGFRATLEGLQEIALSKSINVSASLFEVAMVVVLLPLGFGIKGLLYAYIIKTFAEMVTCTGLVFKKLPGLKLRPGLINKQAFKDLFVFGGKIQILGGLAIFLGSLDRIAITALLGLKATGMYEIGGKFPFTARNLSAAAFGPLLPAASYIGSSWERGDRISPGDRAKKYLTLVFGALVVALLPGIFLIRKIEEKTMSDVQIPYTLAAVAGVLILALFIIRIKKFYSRLLAEDKLIGKDLRDLYLKGFRHINIINVTLFSFLMAAAHPMIISWVGDSYLPAVPVLVLLSFAYMIHQGTGPAGLMVRGINRAGRELEYLLIQFILGIAWIPVGTLLFGITGTALGILGSSVLGSLYFFWRTNHAFRISLREMLKTVMMPALAPAISAASVYGITLIIPTTDRWVSAAEVIILGCLHLGLTFLILWKLFLTHEETETVAKVLNRFRPSKRRNK